MPQYTSDSIYILLKFQNSSIIAISLFICD